MATKKNSHSSKAKPNGKHLQSTTTAISKRQTLSGVHKKTNASLSSGSRKAVNSKLTETIDASLDDLRVVYNSTIQKQTKLAERMERMDEKRRVEERKQVEKEKSMQTDVDLNAALDMLSGL